MRDASSVARSSYSAQQECSQLALSHHVSRFFHPSRTHTIMNTPASKKVSFGIAEPETPVSYTAAAVGHSPAPILATSTLPFFAVPQKKDYRHSTGLVHCVVRREAGKGRFGFTTNRITFSLQKRDGTEIVLLVATKQNGNYTISEVSNEIVTELGGLALASKSTKSLVYLLYQENEQVAVILYHVPSIISVVLDGPPRRAQIAISSSQSHVQHTSGILEAKSKISLHKTRSLRGIDDDQPFLHVFENKDPYSKGKGRWGLNFRGRGRLASSKNMQMENKHQTDSETVVFQIAKWDKNAYNVDFRAPFNMFQAFGFALAQIDI
jgi:hypothetical protein